MKKREIIKELLKTTSFFGIEILLDLLLIVGFNVFWFIRKYSWQEGVEKTNIILEKYNTFVFFFIIISAISAYMIIYKIKNPFRSERKLKLVDIAICALIGSVASLFVNLLTLISESETQQVTYFEAVTYIVVVVFIQPFAEELVFRKNLYHNMSLYTSKCIAIIVSSVAFALCHGNMEQFIYTLPLGIILAGIYEKKGFTGALLLHVSFNTTAMVLALFYGGN